MMKIDWIEIGPGNVARGIISALFINPWFFWSAALLTSIPILIHLLNRRRFKVVEWAAMLFLLQAMRKNRRRLKFEQWLLLATRCALITLIGVALARPMGCENNSLASLAGQRNGLHVFILDNSYSMAYQADRPEARTHFAHAKLLAKKMMDRIVRSGESVVIITAARPAAAVIAKPSYSLDACHSAIDSIVQSYGATDLATALTKATEIARDETRQPNKFLYLITDGTRSAFEGTAAEAIKNASRECQSTFGDADHIHLFNLGLPSQWNQGILDLTVEDNLVTTKFSTSFKAIARGFGNGPDPLLRWQIDEKDIPGTGLVKLSGGSSIAILPNQAIKTGGPHLITASLAGSDSLKIDDTRYRVVNVASEIPVLIVDGERRAGGGSARFLEDAIAPPDSSSKKVGAKSDSVLVPRVISDQDLGDREVLNKYRAIILANVSRVPEATAMQLQLFVEQGGVLMFFMGPRVDGDDYNRTLVNDKIHLLPGKLSEKISVSTTGADSFYFDFRPDGDLSTYLSVFKGLQNSGMDTARVFQYWKINPTDPTTERVLDYLPSGSGARRPVTGPSHPGDPAITVHTLGKGRSIFFSTSADDAWMTFVGKPMFPVLIPELLQKAISPGEAWMNLIVGDRIEVPVNLGITATPILVDSEKKEIPVTAVAAPDGEMVYRSSPLTVPGVYRLSTGSAVFPIAVNVPAEEADVRTLTEPALRSAMGDIAVTIHGDQFVQETSSQLNKGRDPQLGR